MLAARTANARNIPWVFDPVAHFAMPYRKQVALELASLRPTIIRGNASEILALAGESGAGKGTDSGDNVDDAQAAANALALRYGAVVAVTGPSDFLTDGTRSAQLIGGSDLMPRVTALGCSLTALMGAYAAVAPAFDAALAALAHFKVAGSRAGSRAGGPGSFQVNFLDELAAVQPGDLAAAIQP